MGIADGACDCEGNVLDECNACGGLGIVEGFCDCEGNVNDCAGTCGGDAMVDCNGDCGGNAILDGCGICDYDANNDNECLSRPYELLGNWSSQMYEEYENSTCEDEPDATLEIGDRVEISLDDMGEIVISSSDTTLSYSWGINANAEICMINANEKRASCFPYEFANGQVSIKNFPQEFLSLAVECPDGQMEDCNFNCAPENWLGDDYCDDGNYEFNGIEIDLDCEEHLFDGGDCDETILGRQAIPYARHVEYNVFSNESNDDEKNN
jgi:hypothetical protein